MWTIGHELFDPWIPWPKLACVKAGAENAEGLPWVLRQSNVQKFAGEICEINHDPSALPRSGCWSGRTFPLTEAVEDSLFLLVRKFKLTPHGLKLEIICPDTRSTRKWSMWKHQMFAVLLMTSAIVCRLCPGPTWSDCVKLQYPLFTPK